MDDYKAFPGMKPRNLASTAEFNALLQQAQSQLFGYIHSLLRDFNDADDLFQQTAMVLWRKFDEYDRSRSFLAWACGVARLEAANFLRSRGRNRLYFSDDLNLLLIESQDRVSSIDAEARRAALGRCMDRLSQWDRGLLMDCYGERDARVIEIAREQGRSSQSVHNSLRRIRRSLFACVQRTMNQAGHAEAIQ